MLKILNAPSQTHVSVLENFEKLKIEQPTVCDHVHCFHSVSNDEGGEISIVTTHNDQKLFLYNSYTDQSHCTVEHFARSDLVIVRYNSILKFADENTTMKYKAHQAAFRENHRNCDRAQTFINGLTFKNISDSSVISTSTTDLKYRCVSKSKLHFYFYVSMALGLNWFFAVWFNGIPRVIVNVVKTITV